MKKTDEEGKDEYGITDSQRADIWKKLTERRLSKIRKFQKIRKLLFK